MQGRTKQDKEDAGSLVHPLGAFPGASSPKKQTRGGGRKGGKTRRNIMLIIKLQPFLLPVTYFSLLIIHILFQ